MLELHDLEDGAVDLDVVPFLNWLVEITGPLPNTVSGARQTSAGMPGSTRTVR